MYHQHFVSFRFVSLHKNEPPSPALFICYINNKTDDRQKFPPFSPNGNKRRRGFGLPSRGGAWVRCMVIFAWTGDGNLRRGMRNDSAAGFSRLAGNCATSFCFTGSRGIHIVIIQDLGIPVEERRLANISRYLEAYGETDIMIFQVSTGKSASLKDQSNFSSAAGSSVGSWYGERYGWASAPVAVIRFWGSNTNIRSSMSIAIAVSMVVKSIKKIMETLPASSKFLNLFLRGCRSLFGND